MTISPLKIAQTAQLKILLWLLIVFGGIWGQTKWEWRMPFPQGNTLTSVTYGKNMYVAVGASGTILTSSDGNAWVQRTSATRERFTGIAFGKDIFLIVGEAGTVLISSDGIVWTLQNEIDKDLRGVAFGNDRFVVIGSKGACWSNDDPVKKVAWLARFTKHTYDFSSISFSNNQFIIAGRTEQYANLLLFSVEGMDWRCPEAGTWSVPASVTYGNGLYVAVGGSGSGSLITSSDGELWTSQQPFGSGNRDRSGSIFGDLS
ncbi:MAG: hypothetical protein JW795_13895 [Chitinivibrionales bacterium]|nr:hypothetical protein [Chitinivibrionales bacterium]